MKIFNIDFQIYCKNMESFNIEEYILIEFRKKIVLYLHRLRGNVYRIAEICNYLYSFIITWTFDII